MKKPKTEPSVGKFLDDEEQEIIEALEKPGFRPKNFLTPALSKKYKAAARATMNEARVKISLRVPKSDLARLKAKALKEGMPYQTLIGSILHKAVTG